MRPGTLFGIALTIVGSTSAHAQTPVFDHLQCFRVSGTNLSGLPPSVTADLNPEQAPPFAPAPGCKVRTTPKFLCIDVAKQNVQPPGSTLPITGNPTRDYLCYDVKCPRPAGGLVGGVVSDQFGEHRITTRPSRYLCVPAISGPAPRPTAAPCNDLGGGQCSDTCPGNYQCLFVPAGFDLIGPPLFPIDITGTNDCRCVPPDVGCETNPSPSVCSVAGPALLCSNADEQCASDAGSCSCAPAPCGTTTCPPGTRCCNPLLDLCAAPGEVCIQ